MSNILSDKDKNQNPRADGQSGHNTVRTDFQGKTQIASFGAYGQGMTHDAKLTAKDWEAETRQPWNSTAGGRLAIRTFSRGVMGAMFFTAGGAISRKYLHSDKINGTRIRYNPEASFAEQKNLLQIFAKIIDTFVGKPIEWTVKNGSMLVGVSETTANDWAKRSTRFRPTKFAGDTKRGSIYRGRSLGNEAVSITFDFFCASVGDAMGRDIVGLVDPNVKKTWWDDKGFHLPEAVKALGNASWRYLTYNGGEDWAVAIPYAYYMKAQREVMKKISPGFEYDFDRGLSGNSFKINDEGKIVGNYSVEGAIDLQGRFTAYNIGTLMYRELYDYAAQRIQGKRASLFGAPDKSDDHRGFFGNIAEVGKWIARSVVKGTLYMTPVVPAFWITRATQVKDAGLLINPKRGMLIQTAESRTSGSTMYNAVSFRNNIKNKQLEDLTPFQYSQYSYPRDTGANTGFKTSEDVFLEKYPHLARIVGHNPNMEPYIAAYDRKDKPVHAALDAPLNAIGQFNNTTAKSLDGFAGWVDKHSWGKWLNGKLGYAPHDTYNPKTDPDPQLFNKFTRGTVNAAFSYTPYMYAKAEASRLWDDGKMDMATERMIDGMAHLNWGEFTAGAGETWRAFLHKPLTDPAREAEAQHRKDMDSSPPVDVARKGEGLVSSLFKSSWRDRVVQGRPEKTADKDAELPKVASYVDQEELRKALNEMNPPTNSVH